MDRPWLGPATFLAVLYISNRQAVTTELSSKILKLLIGFIILLLIAQIVQKILMEG